MGNKNLEIFNSLVGDIPSYVLIAAAVMNDNALLMGNGMTEKYLDMAEHISEQISVMDEPRFTLYDYLDACINSNAKPFDGWIQEAEMAFQSEESTGRFMAMVINEAEKKRNIYSMRA